MTVANGQNIDASDYINTSAGAGSAGKIVKLDSAGKINPNMTKRFGCKVYQNAGTAIANSGRSTMLFQVEEFDDDTMHSTSSNTSRITFNTAGYYLVGASCRHAGSSSSAVLGCGITLNGTTVIAGGGGAYWDAGASTSVVRHFAAGDYIEFSVISPGGSTSSSGDEGTNFWALLVQKD